MSKKGEITDQELATRAHVAAQKCESTYSTMFNGHAKFVQCATWLEIIAAATGVNLPFIVLPIITAILASLRSCKFITVHSGFKTPTCAYVSASFCF